MSRRPAVPAAAHAAASAVGALRSARGSLLLSRQPRTLRSANAPDGAVILVAIDRTGGRKPSERVVTIVVARTIDGRARSWLAQPRQAQGVSS